MQDLSGSGMRGSITGLYCASRNGCEKSRDKLLAQLYPRLLDWIKTDHRYRDDSVVNEDDVAQMTVMSLWAHQCNGKMPDLQSRKELFRYVRRIVSNAIVDNNRAGFATKRDSRRVSEYDVYQFARTTEAECAFNILLDEFLGDSLDEELRLILFYRLGGFRNREIAKLIGVATCSVERKFSRVRRLLELKS